MELYLEAAESDDFSFNWDIIVDHDGNVGYIDSTSDSYTRQQANFVMFLIKGTIPLMEDYGVDWVGWLFKEINLVQLNSEITEILTEYLGIDNGYFPQFSVEDGKLKVDLGTIQMQE